MLARLDVAEADRPDHELVARAYRRWGVHSFVELIGEFAAILWDAPNQKLVCLCDALGQYSLFYRRDAQQIRCGSQLRFVRDASDGCLDENSIVRHLNAVSLEPGRTFYADIARVPAGHYVAIDRDGTFSSGPYWDPRSIPHRDTDSDDAANDFRHRFLEAVRCRLPESGEQLAVQVSGGFDSSAVVGAAHQCLVDGGLSRKVLGISNTADRPEADERSYQKLVFERYQALIREGTTRAEDFWAFRSREIVGREWEQPLLADYAARMDANVRAAKAFGASVLMSGDAGDEVGGSSWYLVDRLLRGRLRGSWRELKLRAQARGVASRKLMRTLASLSVRHLLGRGIHASSSAPWVKGGTTDDGAQGPGDRIFANPARQDLWERLQHFWLDSHYSFNKEFYRQSGVEIAQPFLDRRVVEWALSVPPHLHGSNGLVKSLLRDGLQDLVPTEIVRRGDKGNYLYYWDLGVRDKERERIEQLLARPLLAEFGFVEPRILRDAYRQYCDGGPIHRRQLWNAVVLEDWLRTRLSQ